MATVRNSIFFKLYLAIFANVNIKFWRGRIDSFHNRNFFLTTFSYRHLCFVTFLEDINKKEKLDLSLSILDNR